MGRHDVDWPCEFWRSGALLHHTGLGIDVVLCHLGRRRQAVGAERHRQQLQVILASAHTHTGFRTPIVRTCPSVNTSHLESMSNMKTGMSSSQNSRMNWRHMPHGELGGDFMSVDTPSARKPRLPSVYARVFLAAARRAHGGVRTMALDSAVRSAQMPTGYDAFSTLPPVTHVPSAQSSAHPTRKLE